MPGCANKAIEHPCNNLNMSASALQFAITAALFQNPQMMKTKEVQVRKNKELLKCNDEIDRHKHRLSEMQKTLKISSAECLKLGEHVHTLQSAPRTG